MLSSILRCQKIQNQGRELAEKLKTFCSELYLECWRSVSHLQVVKSSFLSNLLGRGFQVVGPYMWLPLLKEVDGNKMQMISEAPSSCSLPPLLLSLISRLASSSSLPSAEVIKEVLKQNIGKIRATRWQPHLAKLWQLVRLAPSTLHTEAAHCLTFVWWIAMMHMHCIAASQFLISRFMFWIHTLVAFFTAHILKSHFSWWHMF